MFDVCRLYPQYNLSKERRQQQAPTSSYPYERRSGNERRSPDRVTLDSNLTKDIFEIRDKISKIQKTPKSINTNESSSIASQKNDKIAFSQNISKAAQNSIKTDQFIKSVKTNMVETPKEIAKSNSHTGILGGMIAVMLGGTIGSVFLGTAGVGIAIGLGAYFGGKFLKSAIVEHIKTK